MNAHGIKSWLCLLDYNICGQSIFYVSHKSARREFVYISVCIKFWYAQLPKKHAQMMSIKVGLVPICLFNQRSESQFRIIDFNFSNIIEKLIKTFHKHWLKAIIKKKPDLDILKLTNAKDLKMTSKKYIKDIDSYIKF